MARKLYPDKWLFAATVGLTLFGVVMVYSASAVMAQRENGSQFYYVIKQGISTVIGFGVMLVMMQLDYTRLRDRRIVYGLLSLTVVMLLAVFAFPRINGAHRWIKLSSFSIQPSELSKLSLAIFLAYFLEKRTGEEKSFWRTFVPCVFVTGVIAILIIAEPDLGTAMMLAVIFGVLVYAAGARLLHLAMVAAPALVGVIGLLVFVPFRMRRMIMFLDPWADPQGSGFQVVQSLIAIGSGGSNGLGFAQGKQKMMFLPYAHSDFIFAVIGEELGLVGTMTVLLVFALFLWRGIRTSLLAPDRFAMLLSLGLVTGIVAQALFNISVVLSLVPTKGIPLPFISSGGSSLVPTLAAVGILLNISQHCTGSVTLGVLRAIAGNGDKKTEKIARRDCQAIGLFAPWVTTMRVLIAAGGTGGHIYPGIAVAKEIMRRDPKSEVRFVGTARGLESKLVPQAGFELSIIESTGLKNVGPIARARGLLVLPRSLVSARRLINEFRPDVVIGAGGYVSGPVVLRAALMNLPTLVMESNALPGWTNRVLARFVDKAAVSFEAAQPYFRGKAIVTGNPVRREFFEIQRGKRNETGRSQLAILIFGGSQGAHAINEAMTQALPMLEELREMLLITHQTGEADFAAVRDAYVQAGWADRSNVRRYIDDMVASFAEVDLVICRAGATTTAELIAAGKAALMIPFPFAADDHQRKNAEALEKAGAAKMILQQDLSGERLAREIATLASHPQRISDMEEASRNLARGDAASAVVDMIEKLVSGER